MDNKLINEIISLAENGGARGNDITSIYAQVYNALKNTLGITPYAEQIGAALALSGHNMVQMQTGEGKTFSAVFAACYEALTGGQVMILTFNDYLARRDYEWTKPVYDKMGVSLGCITADTPREDRRRIYSKKVVYLTAKEAGFDYLRDFVCFEPDEMVFPQKLNFAIVDEADSIMIDEARIPLVIAGDIAAEDDGSTAEVYEKVSDFTDDDYGIDEDSRNIYLTDEGADRAESIFGCDIYAAGNTGLLAKICACLKAQVMLEEDKDYILRDGAVILVDEFTGRAAPGRVFPGDLQAAVEAKHGLTITSRGRIMGNIALQYFLRLFPKLAGMTGTAMQSREEFDTIYGLPTQEIPTRLPCRRIDHPLEMYFDKTEKRKAVVEAIREAHEISRPVLVGTESIGESEELAAELNERGIECAVLNAKNDEAEADIISRAGEPGAVTISTNMAGRGVDIKLGGADCHAKAEVERAGGLLVLATAMRESSRITQQLRGRAGRQGDVGESRFFAALDDEIMTRNDLRSLVSGRHYPNERVSGPIGDKSLLKEAERVQRISEGSTFDERVKLMKYTMIGEKHRAMTFEKRTALLDGSYSADLWQKHAPDLWDKAAEKFGEEELQRKQDIVLAALLNEFWCDYLDYTAYLREGIHLTQIAGRNPAEEYNIACEEYYQGAAESLPDRMAEKLEAILECDSLDDYQPLMPSRTYTYLLNDSGEEFKRKPLLLSVFTDNEEIADGKPKSKPESPADNEEKPQKKGFFAKLFGKK